MLTRKQVAEKLGRSVSTVRRLEGTRLHPKVTGRGTHLFDTDEVENLAREVQETGRALEPSERTVPQHGGPTWDEYDDLQEVVDKLKTENRDLITQLEETGSREDLAHAQLLSLRRSVKSWAADIDKGCALLISAETEELQGIVVKALAQLLDQPPE